MKNDGVFQRAGGWRGVKNMLLTATFRNQLNKSIFGSYGLLVISVGLSLLTSIILARFLGAAGYGDYAYAMTWAIVLSTVAQAGLDRLALRSTSAYQAKAEWGLLNGLVRWVLRNATLISVLVAATGIGLSRLLIDSADPVTLLTLNLAFLMLPFLVFTRVAQGVLRGLGHILQGQIAEILIRPFLLAGFLALVFVLNRSLSPPQAMGLHVIAAVVGAAVGLVILLRVYPSAARGAPPLIEPKLWWAVALPFLLTSVLESLNQRVDILILGSVAGTESVGIYNVVKRLAEPALFMLISVDMALAPRISRLHAADDRAEIQAVVTRSARLILYITLPISLFLIVAGPWLLQLWGSEFREGYIALIIVSLGYLANAATGPVILLLNMTSHERAAMLGVGVGVVANIALGYLLIPVYGLNGAATAFAISSLVLNLFLVYYVRRQLGVDATVLGRMPSTRATVGQPGDDE